VAHENQIEKLEMHLFGGFSLQRNGEPLRRMRSKQGQLVLSLLLLRHDRETAREWLAETLWPESLPEQAYYNLRRNLTDIRQVLEEDAGRLEGATGTLQFNTEGLFCDVLEFDRAIQKGGTEALERAISLYKGDLLAGFYEEWILPERIAREQAFLQAMEHLAQEQFDSGQWLEAIGYLKQILTHDPLQESALRLLLRAYAERGERVALAQCYRDFRLQYYRELHAEPSPETRSLYEQLQKQTPVAPPPSQKQEQKIHLPHPITALIGRDTEQYEIWERLQKVRLLTLLGPGGVGKTRLALAVAHQSTTRFSGGIWFLDLAAVQQGTALIPLLVRTLNIKGEALEDVAQRIGEQVVLLIFDNCEHLIEAVAEALGTLMNSCANLRVLATSRQALGIMGEELVTISPLLCPPASRQNPRESLHSQSDEKNVTALLLDYPAVQLFVERARHVSPTLELSRANLEAVGSICRHLDGIPLAIELAAARANAFTVQEIEEQLEDRFSFLNYGNRTARPRHQTLQGLLDWSYNLLSREERTLWKRLAVFVGSATLEAITAVCADAPSGRKIGKSTLAVLVGGLVEKSVLVRTVTGGVTRYGMLESLREYAQSLWEDEQGERGRFALRHAVWYLHRIEPIALLMRNDLPTADMESLEQEHDQIRGALVWCREYEGTLTEENPLEIGARLASCAANFWSARGYQSEGRAVLQAFMDAYKPPLPNALVASLWLDMGNLAHDQGELKFALTCMQEALTQFEVLGNEERIADVRFDLGTLYGNAGEYDKAIANFDIALAYSESQNHRVNVGKTRGQIGYIAFCRKDYVTARKCYLEALEILQAEGIGLWTAWCLGCLASVELEEGNYPRACELLRQEQLLQQRLQRPAGEAWVLVMQGACYRRMGDVKQAHFCIESALQIARTLELRSMEAWGCTELSQLLMLEQRGEEADAQIRYAVGLARSIGNTAYAFTACVASVREFRAVGEKQRAEYWAGEARRIAEEAQIPAWFEELEAVLSDGAT
jgi:predicted ATPase/Tfp pilus assembly protein PilF